MSKVQVDTIVDKDDISAPTFSKGAIVTGVCTATTFVGALSGNATSATTATTASGNAGGLTGTPDISCGTIAGSTGTFTDDVTIVKTSGALLEVTTNTNAADATLRLSEGATGSTSNGGGMFYSGADNRLYITCGTDSTTKRITINRDDGKVGVGTTIPTTKFDIQEGTTGLRFNRNNNTPELDFKSNTVDEAGKIRCAESTGGGILQFNTKTTGGVDTERIRIGTSGEIGIAGANYGTSGQVLTSGGSGAAVSWADAGGGEWTLLASGTPTSGTNETITESHFSSTYWRYKVVFNMNCTTQGLFGFQIKNSSGWITSATYMHQQFYNQNNAAIHDYYNNGEFMRPFWFPDGGRQWRGTLHLWNPSASDGEKYWYYENVQALNQTTYSGSSYFWSGGQPQAGSFTSNTSAITGLRMYMEEGITERCGGGTDTAGVSQWVLYGAKSS